MKTLLVFSACLILSLENSNALTFISEIASPQGCPENLQITVTEDPKSRDLLKVSVKFIPEEPSPHEGRVTAACALIAKDGEKTIAKVTPKMTKGKGNQWSCSFRLHRDSFNNSQLNVVSQLNERDGLPTVGGGEIYHVALAKFAPAPTATAVE